MSETKALRNLRRKGGAWYYDHGGNPRRYEPLGSDEAKALARYHAIRNAEPVKAGTVDAMVRDLIVDLETKKSKAPGTIRQYKQYRKHIGAVFGAMKPEHLTQQDVLRYLYDCPRLSFSNEVGVLSMAFMLWMRTRGLTFNPCLGVRADRAKSSRGRLLSDREIEAIVSQADDRLALAIEIGYATGLRIGDVCRLRWQDLGDGAMLTQKTGARLGWESTEGFGAILDRARAIQSNVGSLYVLCNRRGQPFKPQAIRDRWLVACAKAGVPDAQFRDLRAASATEKERQEGREAAQKFLAHRHATTTDTYLRGRRTSIVKPLTRKRG